MKENFNVKGKNGSIAIFVLVGLLFMSGFLILSYGYNVNKSKISKEQFNSISDIYSHKDGDANAYERAYTALRKKNKQTLIKTVKNSSILELDKTYEEKLVNYRIYGKGYYLPDEYQEVEYIESTGTQWIDTGVVFKANTKIITEYMLIKNEKSYIWGNSTGGSRLQFRYGGVNEVFFGYGGDVNTGYIIKDISSSPAQLERKYTITCDKGSFYIDNELITTISATTQENDNNGLILFAVRIGNTIQDCSKTRIYSHTVYQNNTLVQNLIPCYRTSDNIIGMYDIVGGKFYTNSGTGTFLRGADITQQAIVGCVGDLVTDLDNENYGTYELPIKVTNIEGQSVTQILYVNKPLKEGEYIDFKTRRIVRKDGTVESIELPELLAYEDYTKIETLTEIVPSKLTMEYIGYNLGGNINLPEEYQQVEYIESTGTQWIDTGVIFKANTKIITKYMLIKNEKSYIWGNSTGGSRLQFRYGGVNEVFFGYGGDANTGYIIKDISSSPAQLERKYTITCDKGSFYIDNELITTISATTQENDNNGLILFAVRMGNTIQDCSKTRIYSHTVYQNNTLVQNLIPCYRTSDDIIGMYDTVEGKFYTNAGTGEFIAGPEV